MSKIRHIDIIKEYLTILVGLALYALGWTGFLLPHGITTGGVTGIGALIYFANGTPVAVTYFLINIGLLILSVKIFGWKFSLKNHLRCIHVDILSVSGTDSDQEAFID